MCELAEEFQQDREIGRNRKTLRLSYDSAVNVSQQEHLFHQINKTQLEHLDQNDIIPNNEFESQL